MALLERNREGNDLAKAKQKSLKTIKFKYLLVFWQQETFQGHKSSEITVCMHISITYTIVTCFITV